MARDGKVNERETRSEATCDELVDDEASRLLSSVEASKAPMDQSSASECIHASRRSNLLRWSLHLILAITMFALGRNTAITGQPSPLGSAGSAKFEENTDASSTSFTDLLDERFGRRAGLSRRDSRLAFPSEALTAEVKGIWDNVTLAQDSHFLAAYVKERYREAVLWSFYFAKIDADGSGQFSLEERQALLSQLGLTQTKKALLSSVSGCTLVLEDCFGSSAFFQRDEEADPSVADITMEHLFKWQAFANPTCGDCVFSTILARGVFDEPDQRCNSLNDFKATSLGYPEDSWRSIRFVPPDKPTLEHTSTGKIALALRCRYKYQEFDDVGRIPQVELVHTA